jgi:soluble lytic murein transglycosylase
LAVDDTVALRLELARFLEGQGDLKGAYSEYRQLLAQRADAFEGMRRTGTDSIAVARDLNAALYYSDALEVLRGVEAAEALPVRAEALAGLQRFAEAEAAYREWLDQAPNDDRSQLGLARAVERQGRSEEALALYQALDTADSRLAQAALLQATDSDAAIALYQDTPYPDAWWSATALLEALGRITETLPLYTRIAQSSATLADDAAYRLLRLAGEAGDDQAQTQAEGLLADLGPNWLALRAGVGPQPMNQAPPMIPDGAEILAKVEALELLGRDDLAHLELRLAANARHVPELDLAMAEALAARGEIRGAQAIAEEYTQGNAHAPLPFWPLSYPRPYTATVEAAAAEFEVDPRLIWAVMREESRFDPEALSYVGARGLMQIMPATQDWIAEQWGEAIPAGDAFAPETNVRMGAWFLRFLLDYFDDDLELAVAAYNGGAGSVDSWLADPLVLDRDDWLRWIGFGETREYLGRVLLSYQVYQQLYPTGGANN